MSCEASEPLFKELGRWLAIKLALYVNNVQGAWHGFGFAFNLNHMLVKSSLIGMNKKEWPKKKSAVGQMTDFMWTAEDKVKHCSVSEHYNLIWVFLFFLHWSSAGCTHPLCSVVQKYQLVVSAFARNQFESQWYFEIYKPQAVLDAVAWLCFDMCLPWSLTVQHQTQCLIKGFLSIII